MYTHGIYQVYVDHLHMEYTRYIHEYTMYIHRSGWRCYCGSRVCQGLSVSVIHLLTSLQASEAARPAYKLYSVFSFSHVTTLNRLVFVKLPTISRQNQRIWHAIQAMSEVPFVRSVIPRIGRIFHPHSHCTHVLPR